MPKRRHISGEEYARQQAQKKERISKLNHECFLQERQERLYGKADATTLYEQYSRSEESGADRDKQRMRQEILERERREAAEKEKREAAAIAEAARARKVLVCGDARGNLAKLFATVEAQEKKVGPFDALLCVGSFLPEAGDAEESLSAYLSGQKKAPMECLFIDPGAVMLQAAPRGRTLGSNIHFLGAYGVREVCGLRVAFLSGHYDPEVYDRTDVDFVGGAFTSRAVAELQRRTAPRQRGVDVLLTCGWPAGLDGLLEGEAPRPPQLEGAPSWEHSCARPLAELCQAVEPRYHLFGSAGVFYQRPPFKAPKRGHACRCIGLGQVGSTNKQQKWLHALALSPMAYMKKEDLAQLHATTTACPFGLSLKRPPEGAEAKALDAKAEEAKAEEAKAAGAKAGEAKAEDAKPEAAAQAEPGGELPQQALAALVAGDYAGYAGLAERLQSRPLASAGGVRGGEDSRAEDPKRKAAEAWLRREPKDGVVRFTFKEEGDLGLRLSRDVVPWILEVQDGTPAARKAPRTPVGGIVIAVNGYELLEEDPYSAEALKAMNRRPAILDIQWPGDQRLPVVKHA
mmetsp:Transcript_174966/g.425693  ORF Transcript_174966/g.425693 Transcript_174966/m.425693 type:complete len:573 (+) Transcript_174966:8-1726(+)